MRSYNNSIEHDFKIITYSNNICKLYFSSLFSFITALSSFFMSGALRHVASWNICVDGSIALSSFDIETLLFGQLLESGPLPFGQPSLWVWWLSWVFMVKVFRVPDLSICSLLRDEDFKSTNLLSFTSFLVFFHLLWHTCINDHLQAVSILQISILDLLLRKHIHRHRHLKIALELDCFL